MPLVNSAIDLTLLIITKNRLPWVSRVVNFNFSCTCGSVVVCPLCLLSALCLIFLFLHTLELTKKLNYVPISAYPSVDTTVYDSCNITTDVSHYLDTLWCSLHMIVHVPSSASGMGGGKPPAYVYVELLG